jgi:two-component system, sporulation sensor kinase B
MKQVLDFPIELWLFQILIILFPTLLYQAYFKKKYGYQFHKTALIAVLCGIPIILCMTFPVEIKEVGFSLDFRYVPLILAFLYGGFGLGISLSVLVLGYRIILGGIGIYLVLSILIVLITFFYFVKYKYKSFGENKKNLYSQGLLLFTIVFYAFAAQFFDDYTLTNTEIVRWVIFSVLNFLTMSVALFLQEGINELDIINEEVMEYEKIHLISQLSTSIAQEIKKPINNVGSVLESLQFAKEISPEDSQKIAESFNELKNVNHILDHYLNLSDGDESKDDLINVHEEMDSVIKSLYAFASLHNIEIKYFYTIDDNRFIKGNRNHFRQALINIIKNGMEACHNGSLEIAVHEMLSSILIVIEDNGDGMSREQLNRLGSPIFTSKKNGTGLGSMVSYNIIASMKGNIEVESRKGKGTVFSITFPKVMV